MPTQSFALANCKATIRIEPNDEHPRALKHLFMSVKYPKLGEMATLTALLINRRAYVNGPTFHQIMDEEHQELADFATTLFDKRGSIKEQLVDHEHHKGTGVWGREINNGLVVYIFAVHVKEKYRRQGVGRWALQRLFSSKHVGARDFAIIWPWPLARRFSSEDTSNQTMADVVAFFHENGFRRIGRTSFMAYSLDHAHPSRSLAIKDDVESNSKYARVEGSPLPENASFEERLHQKEVRQIRHARKYPLHHAVSDLTLTAAQLNATIKDLLDDNPDAIRSQNEDGWTPLHVAARKGNVYAVRVLLALFSPGPQDDLPKRDNLEGTNLLEGCQAAMWESKVFADTFLDGECNGFSEALLRMEYILKVASGGDVGGLDEDAYTAIRKFGCTCNQCHEGWLSPRMRIRLRAQAAWLGKDMEDNMPTFVNGKPLSGMAIDIGLPGINYVPVRLWPQATQDFYKGFIRVLYCINMMLSSKRSLVFDAVFVQLLAIQADEGAVYFQAGGQVVYALDAITAIAAASANGFAEVLCERIISKIEERQVTLPPKERLWKGDDEMERIREEVLLEMDVNEKVSGMFDKRVEQLQVEGRRKGTVMDYGYSTAPKCVNDEEFDRVREMLGLRASMRWGPYSPGIEEPILSMAMVDDETESEEDEEEEKDFDKSID